MRISYSFLSTQKVAQKTTIEELDRCGFFPEEDRVLGEPLSPRLSKQDALGQSLRQIGNVDNDKPPGFTIQVRMLVWRDLKYLHRDRVATTARVVQATMLAVLIGIIFFNVGQSSTATMANIQSQFGAIVLVSIIIMMGPAQAALLAFPEERPVFLREYTTKHYSVQAYFLSRLVMEAILAAIQALAIMSVSFYMISFKGNFGIYYFVSYLLALGSTALAVGLGAAASRSMKIANSLLPVVLLPQIIFIGYFVVPDLIPVWLRWLNYLCPMTYATRILLIDEFYQCSDNPFQNLGCELLLINVQADPDELWWYWLILGAQFIFFRLSALAILHRSANKFY